MSENLGLGWCATRKGHVTPSLLLWNPVNFLTQFYFLVISLYRFSLFRLFPDLIDTQTTCVRVCTCQKIWKSTKQNPCIFVLFTPAWGKNRRSDPLKNEELKTELFEPPLSSRLARYGMWRQIDTDVRDLQAWNFDDQSSTTKVVGDTTTCSWWASFIFAGVNSRSDDIVAHYIRKSWDLQVMEKAKREKSELRLVSAFGDRYKYGWMWIIDGTPTRLRCTKCETLLLPIFESVMTNRVWHYGQKTSELSLTSAFAIIFSTSAHRMDDFHLWGH